MKLRWGILSAARIANAIVNAARYAQFSEVVAVAARDHSRAQAWAAERGIPRVLDSYAALVTCNEIDAVYIPLPNSLHKEWTLRALRNGKHVLCEKPLALTPAEVDEMMNAAEAHAVRLMEAFMYRFHPQIRMAREMVDGGKLGELRLIRASFEYFNSRPTDVRWDPDLGGGALLDVGSYCVNAATLFFDRAPVAVTAAAQFTDRGVDETMAALLEFPGAAFATLDCSFRANYYQQLELHGTAGRLSIPAPWRQDEDPTQILFEHDRQIEPLTAPGANEYREMLDHFSQCVLENRPVAFPPATSRMNTAILEALARSAREKRRVEL